MRTSRPAMLTGYWRAVDMATSDIDWRGGGGDHSLAGNYNRFPLENFDMRGLQFPSWFLQRVWQCLRAWMNGKLQAHAPGSGTGKRNALLRW